MIQKLKKRITFTISIFITLTLVVILVFVNLAAQASIKSYIFQELDRWVFDESSNKIDEISNIETATVLVTDTTQVLENSELLKISEEKLIEIAEKIAENKNPEAERGIYKNKYYFLRKQIGRDTIVIVITTIAGNNEAFESFISLRKNTILISVFGIVFSIWLASLLARTLVKPVKETFENERAFISDASHELKTPIAVISANAEALETDIGENKWLSCIKSESMRMSGLITDMLTISRVEKNNDRSTFKKVNLTSCTEEILMNFEALAYEKGVRIYAALGENVTCLGSEERLKQLITILVDNAVKYVNKGGKININLSSKLGSTTLVVENTGSFISKEDQKKVFERFYRTDESRTREETNARSYGLGLAIAKRITEAHNGNISVSSSKSADGTDSTTFKVVI